MAAIDTEDPAVRDAVAAAQEASRKVTTARLDLERAIAERNAHLRALAALRMSYRQIADCVGNDLTKSGVRFSLRSK